MGVDTITLAPGLTVTRTPDGNVTWHAEQGYPDLDAVRGAALSAHRLARHQAEAYADVLEHWLPRATKETGNA